MLSFCIIFCKKCNVQFTKISKNLNTRIFIPIVDITETSCSFSKKKNKFSSAGLKSKMTLGLGKVADLSYRPKERKEKLQSGKLLRREIIL